MASCWIEINTGAGEFVRVLDFPDVTDGMQVLLNLSGNSALLKNNNSLLVSQVGLAFKVVLNQINQSVNTIATRQQAEHFQALAKFLDAVHDAGLQHPSCTFRSVVGLPVII
jgi:hypothetical protein